MLILLLQHYKELDTKAWNDLKKGGQTYVTLFFAPWCGHCKQFAGDYQRAGKKLAGVLDFVSVDCTTEANKQLCQSQQVQGYPTIKIFNHASGKKPQTYEGARTADDVQRWALGLQKRPFVQMKGSDVTLIQGVEAEADFLLITTPSKKASTLAFKLAKHLGRKAQTFVHVGFSAEALASYEPLGLKDLLGKVD